MMVVMITTQENRKYPAWLVRARVGTQWYEVVNVTHPRFWADWWTMWQGKRAWALRWYGRHIVRRCEPSIYLPEVGDV